MPLYMTQFAYTPEAWAALTKKPENRAEGLSRLAKEMGGRLVDMYYCFGDFDGVALIEAPDDATAAATIMAAAAPGHLKATRTTRLIPVTEAMEAMKKAGNVAYAPPQGMAERAGARR